MESGEEFWLGVESTIVEGGLLLCGADSSGDITGESWGDNKSPEAKNNWVHCCKTSFWCGLEWDGPEGLRGVLAFFLIQFTIRLDLTTFGGNGFTYSKL